MYVSLKFVCEYRQIFCTSFLFWFKFHTLRFLLNKIISIQCFPNIFQKSFHSNRIGPWNENWNNIFKFIIHFVIRAARTFKKLTSYAQSFRTEFFCKNMFGVSPECIIKLSCHVVEYPIVFKYDILRDPLERVYEIKDLGLVLDRTLSFAPHFLEREI